MRLLALDFDGVISDSAPEGFAVALRTFAELQPESGLCDHPLARAAGIPAAESIARDPLYARFLELMPLGNRAEDYAVALAAIDEGESIADQADYDAYRDRLDAAWLRAYHKRFYAVRAELAERDAAAWRRLMGPYRELLDVLRRRAGEAILAIATAKDRGSVHALLRSYGVDDLFAGDRVLDKETGVSKAAHLTHLRQRFGVDWSEITFVDDKVNHLDSAAPLGVRCALAAWGYNGPRELALARERRYLVCRLEDVEAQLFV
jgi:phosphoglycolate phosphatase-like HAD superfamily hydrolase